MHCVDLGKSFQTHSCLQNFVSIQPRTSLVKFASSRDTPTAPWHDVIELKLEEFAGREGSPADPPHHALGSRSAAGTRMRKLRESQRANFFMKSDIISLKIAVIGLN